MSDPAGPSLLVWGTVFLGVGGALAAWIPAIGRRTVSWHTYFFPRWTFSDLVLVAVVWLVVSAVALASTSSSGFRGLEMFTRLVLAMAVGGAGAVVAIAWRLHRREPEPWRAIGLHRAHALSSVRLGLAGFPGVFLAVVGVRLLTLAAQGTSTEAEALMQPEVAGLLTLEPGRLVLVSVYIVVLGPIFEEVVFRGFLQPWLVQNLGWNAGLVITAAAFAALHGWLQFPAIFVLGLYLGWLARRTRSLWAPVSVHVLNNTIVVALVWAMRDLLAEVQGG